MQESSNILISESSSQQNFDTEYSYTELKELVISIIKFLSFVLILLALFLQFQFLLYFTLKTFTNIYLTISLIILFYYILLRFGVQSFLYILKCPLLGSLVFYGISCNQLRELLESLKQYINIYKNLKNQHKAYMKDVMDAIVNISNVVDSYLVFFSELKNLGKLTKPQSDLHKNLCLWMKNYEEYTNKNIDLIDDNEEKNEKEENEKNFIYYMRQMHNNSNEIITILDNFICDNYQFLSLRSIYNCFINNAFSSIDQYSILFNRKFNGTIYSFITSDNKLIDYSIITYEKLDKMYKMKEIDKNIKGKKEHIGSKNLLIFCNPNAMIYQIIIPEKFLCFLEGRCDILLWNYRGYGYSTGYPTFKNAKTDIVELFDFIKKKGLYKKYGVFGYSVGGGSATFLSQKRHLDILICDRNYTKVSTIARSYSSYGEFLYFLSKILNFKYDYNVSEYIKSKNKNICKIILCDPQDEVIPNSASLKSGISKYIIKSYCIENKLKITENILELLLNSKNKTNQKIKFIESLLFIMEIRKKIDQDPNIDLIDKKQSLNINEDNHDKSHLLTMDGNMEINERKFKKKVIRVIYNFFECFNNSSENLESFEFIEEKRLKIIHIYTYFNNFFIWGSRANIHRENENGVLNAFNTKNNSYYLNSAIDYLNEFLNDKFIKSMLANEDYKELYNHLMLIKNCTQILKNKNDFSTISKKFNIGSLIKLDCGHNGLQSEEETKTLVNILKNVDFIK